MNADSETHDTGVGKAHWIGAGFVLAFAASVFTVIYTGLMVEGARSEFDVGFRSVTLALADVRSVKLYFDSPAAFSEVRLEVTLPEMLELADSAGLAVTPLRVALEPGTNELAVDVRATTLGSGYLVARVIGDEPIALDRVFVTVIPN
jgi:hypothetical protein